jgi:hypothetical protein
VQLGRWQVQAARCFLAVHKSVHVVFLSTALALHWHMLQQVCRFRSVPGHGMLPYPLLATTALKNLADRRSCGPLSKQDL